MRALATAAVALTALAACATATAAPQATVRVGDNFIRPAEKTVSVGTRVSFRWIGAARHHIVKSKGPGGPIASPPTAKSGVNLAKTFGRTGTYRFLCRIHPSEMRLKLVVR
jgi:plastocyanin